MIGFVKIHRDIMETGAGRQAVCVGVFTMLVMRARRAAGFEGGVAVPRGSVFATLDGMARDFGVSKETLRSTLRKLESNTLIHANGTRRGVEISICNYDRYQGFFGEAPHDINTSGHTNGTGMQHAGAHPDGGGYKGGDCVPEEKRREENTPPSHGGAEAREAGSGEVGSGTAAAGYPATAEEVIRRYEEAYPHEHGKATIEQAQHYLDTRTVQEWVRGLSRGPMNPRRVAVDFRLWLGNEWKFRKPESAAGEAAPRVNLFTELALKEAGYE